MDPALIKIAIGGVVLLGCIGLFFGIGLAIAAHKFAVETNPLIEEVLESLPLAQCGGCGYPGCEGYAIAVVTDPDVPPNLCFPGKERVAAVVAELDREKNDGGRGSDRGGPLFAGRGPGQPQARIYRFRLLHCGQSWFRRAFELPVRLYRSGRMRRGLPLRRH